LWTKHISQSFVNGELYAYLNDEDPYLRAWAIQFLTEDDNIPDETIQRLEALAENESSAVVRLYLAAAMQRIPMTDRWTLAENLAAHKADADDPNILLMLWFAIEPLVESSSSRALALADQSELPTITRHIARRLVDANKVELLANALDNESANRIYLLTGMLAGMEGRTDLKECLPS